ncbi:hypothetical protein [Streptomyces tauricus]|uniref:hypothetical protein n=1 Tax=Streptomyces tauricus TaxID=68274 RepID=UPI00224431BB|nr:hypothetical protein [Streptomyces tauricus]MCW8099792.1 hypothetical protein [Streptomyces tauricus]
MSDHPNPHLKSIPVTPTRSGPAEPAVPVTDRRAPKVVAEGVRTALVLDPDAVTVSGICPGLQVRFTRPPVADWLCACGHHERARGRGAVAALTARVIVGICLHDTPAQEGRAAA